MGNNKNWWLIVIVSVVVAVIASILTVIVMQKNVNLSPTIFKEGAVFSSNSYIQGTFQSTASAGGIALKSVDGKQFEIQSVQTGGIPGNYKNGFIIYDRNRNQYRVVIDNDGNVGIGSRIPEAKLDVNGSIRANNIYTKENLDGWLSHFYQVAEISNATSGNGYSNDRVRLLGFNSYVDAVITSEGTGTITLNGRTYSIKYYGSSTDPAEKRYIEIDYKKYTRGTYLLI